MSEDKKIPVSIFGEETDNVWFGPDYYHEIKDSDLRGRLSHSYWSGMLVGITVAIVGAALAVFILM